MPIKAAVILSERSESKDPGNDSTANAAESAKIPPRGFALGGMKRLLHCVFLLFCLL